MTGLAARLAGLPARLAEGLRAHRVPGASLAVLEGDEVFATAAGVLNARTGVEATPDSVFQMGSITKPWTATLVMELVEERRLRLADRVVDVLPGFTLRDPAAARRITVEQLLTHTSGIDGDQFLALGRGDEAVARFVAAARDFALVHPPGEGWSYCNAGFVLAGRIVEVLRGAPFDAVLRERLIRPLGLAATGTLAEEAILHRAAAGHLVDLASGATSVVPIWALERSNAPAGATPFTTAPELLAFARLHLDGGTARGARLLAAATIADMQRRRVVLPPASLADAWGLGWMLHEWEGGSAFGHSGATLGQRAWLVAVPRARVALALLTNGGDGESLWRALAEPLLRERAGVAIGGLPPVRDDVAVAPARFAGVYERAGARIVVEPAGPGAITARVRALWASLDPDPPPVPLRPVAPDLFRIALPSSRQDAGAAFLDPTGRGAPSLLLLGGRAHPRVSGSPPG
jgi:CubicO group peptidase (beta-lactamase class C family)